ncbi:acyl-CoA dehydrogenase family protein [Natrialba sp. PRR66]|uniref:acyl-CoA dehydrogenase family protein n=1 Tax=Natrialba sp. PRR66 TaxID=3098146 RepID=UPI002B1DAC13|nr:acyl-CoA dehydrogenase family protein [Natrialba sp. PRR66]
MDVTVPFEQRAMLEEIRRFGENEIGPVADEFDRAEEYPAAIMDEAAEIGLLGSRFPVEYGGAGDVDDFDAQRFYRDKDHPAL